MTTLHQHGAPPSPEELRPRDIGDLTLAAGYPSISVTMPTRPAPRMLLADAERLQELVREVQRQLHEQRVPAAARLLDRVRLLADRAMLQATDHGLAIYVNLAVERMFRLPLPVTGRAVVEQTFATRDLVRVLHRVPPHLLLVLHPACAHLYRSASGTLRLVAGCFPMVGPATHPLTSSGTGTGTDLLDGYLDEVERTLASYRADHPSPLVLAGTPSLLDRFTARSRQLHRLAGRVPEGCDTPEEYDAAVRRLLAEYLRSRRTEARDLVSEALAERPEDVAQGVRAAWEAVHEAEPQMLLVEEGYSHPGRHETTGTPVHDLVDDLIELVILRGGQLALMGPGDLVELGRVVLVSRRPGSRRSRARGSRRR